MPEEPVNPFGPQQPQPQLPPQIGGLASLTPQEGQESPEGGSYFSVSPEVLNMLWAPPPEQQPPLPEEQPPPQPPVF